MASIYDLKPRFQALLRPITRGLARIGVTANAVTLAALILSIAHGFWLALLPGAPWPLLLLPVTLLLRMALNAIDGMLAREHGMASVRGAMLNELSDVVADAALYLPFAFIPGVNGPLVVSWSCSRSSARWRARSDRHSARRGAMTGRTAPLPSG